MFPSFRNEKPVHLLADWWATSIAFPVKLEKIHIDTDSKAQDWFLFLLHEDQENPRRSNREQK